MFQEAPRVVDVLLREGAALSLASRSLHAPSHTRMPLATCPSPPQSQDVDMAVVKKMVPDAMDAEAWFKSVGKWSNGDKFASMK